VTDVRIRLREQAATQQPASSATITWVPSATVTVAGGLLLPAPKAVGFIGTEVTVTGLEPCDGLAGWVWQVTVTADGVIRDQRNVIVPDSVAVLDFENLTTLKLGEISSQDASSVWVGLDDDPPPAWFRGWWLVSAPGNPALGIETGSGDLRSVL